MRFLFSLCKKLLFRTLAPPFCIQCQKFLEDGFLCAQCSRTIIPIATRNLHITKKYSAPIFAMSDYQEPLRSLVKAKHYSDRLASKRLGVLLWERTDLANLDFEIIVPVPLHWTRYAWRWFNQAEVIAHELSLKSGKPVVQILKRVRRTDYQTGLAREKRLTNLAGAFSLIKEAERHRGKSILLVDDVMTTGTTLLACCKELIKIRPNKISVGVACRTL